MLKPTNYDSLIIQDYTPIKLGGHYLEIIDVRESVSRSGNPLLIIRFDFAENDAQAGIFFKRYANDTHTEPRWPSQATYYIVPVNEKNECTRSLKQFVAAVEQSNPDFKVNWIEGPDFVKQFAGKYVGGIFGNLEEEYNGEYFIRRKLRWFCSCSSVPDVPIPKDKLLKKRSLESSESIGDLNTPPFDDDAF